MKKRLLSICLCLLFVMLTIPAFPTFAASRDRIRLLIDLDILQEQKHTGLIPRGFDRSAFARILARMSDVSIGSDGYSAFFTEVADYAEDIVNDSNCGEIIYVLSNGYMENAEENKFRPTAAVTYMDAVRAMVKRLEYGPLAASYGGDDGAYMRVAGKIGLLKGVHVADTEKLTFNEVANMTANAMGITLFDVKPIDIQNTSACLYDWWGIQVGNGTLMANSNLGLATEAAGAGYVNIDGRKYRTDLLVRNDTVGAQVTYYTREVNGELRVVSISVDVTSSNITLNAEDIAGVSKKAGRFVIAYENGEEELKLEQSAYAIVNGYTQSPTQELFDAFLSGEVTFIDTDGNGVYDVAHFLLLKQGIIEGVSHTNGTLTTAYDYDKVSIDSGDYAEIYLNNRAAELGELSAGMAVGIACDSFTFANGRVVFDFTKAEKIWIRAASAEMTGTVTGVSKDEAVIADMSIHFGEGYNRLIADGKITPLTVGMTVTVQTDCYGNLVDYKVSNEGGNMQYGYLIAASYTEKGLSKTLQMRIMDESGAIRIYRVEDKYTLDGERIKPTGTTVTVGSTYSVNLAERQVVRFRANEDFILQELDTAAVGIKEGAKGTLTADLPCNPYAASPARYYVYGGNIQRLFIFAKDCLLFVDEAGRDDTNPEDKKFSIGSVSGLQQEQTIGGYDANDMQELACVVNYTNLEGGAVGTTRRSLKYSETGYVVESIAKMVDGEGNPGWRITVGGYGKKSNYFVPEDTVALYEATDWNDGDYLTLTSRETETFETLIAGGDVIRFTTNKAGEMIYIEKLFDFSDNKNKITAVADKGGQSWGFMNVERVKNTTIIFSAGNVQQNPALETYVCKILQTRNPTVPVYHVGRGKVVMTSYSDLPSAAAGDTVQIFLRFYAKGETRDTIFYVYD